MFCVLCHGAQLQVPPGSAVAGRNGPESGAGLEGKDMARHGYLALHQFECRECGMKKTAMGILSSSFIVRDVSLLASCAGSSVSHTASWGWSNEKAPEVLTEVRLDFTAPQAVVSMAGVGFLKAVIASSSNNSC